ncbi:MAG: hypothetical protein M2R45_02472 [Verrucomicrobia subdivision 3 bacterium]|nr:hypothetical protein [Limisphaerales bacterium]MCS1413260.1 hypothetical protein [Limisphaerales bacterium]
MNTRLPVRLSSASLFGISQAQPNLLSIRETARWTSPWRATRRDLRLERSQNNLPLLQTHYDPEQHPSHLQSPTKTPRPRNLSSRNLVGFWGCRWQRLLGDESQDHRWALRHRSNGEENEMLHLIVIQSIFIRNPTTASMTTEISEGRCALLRSHRQQFRNHLTRFTRPLEYHHGQHIQLAGDEQRPE